MIVTVRYIHPGLIFAVKVGPYPSGAPYEYTSSLAHKYWITMEVTDSGIISILK
jgi:hypothetical protein